MKSLFLLLAFSCALSAVHARKVPKQTVYSSVAAALSENKKLSTLFEAFKASGLQPPEGATLFAPTNKALADDDLQDDIGLTIIELLQPAHKDTLVKLLQYHIVPSAALTTTQLTHGQQLATALAGAAPLTVKADHDDDDDDDDDDEDLEIMADGHDAELKRKRANVKAGTTVIHVIDEVLIPSSLRAMARKGAQATQPIAKPATTSPLE